MSATARDVLMWASRQVRTRELPKGSNLQPYAAVAGHADGQPWCATFLVAAWKANDVHLVDGTDTPSTPAMHTAFDRANRLHTDPRAGDAGFLFEKSVNRIGHVFMVEKVEGDYVTTIEGNTNLDGGREGIGVFRHHRKWRGVDRVRGFGRPLYAAPAQRPTVSVTGIQDSRIVDIGGPDGATSRPDQVRIVESALLAEGLLSARYAKDGSFGSVTKIAYAQWQRRLGFTGDDADGVVGVESLTKLGRKHGFVVTP